MFRDEKNLKDSQANLLKDTTMSAPYQAKGFHVGPVVLSYTKVDKLINALYMVTDIVDTAEPLRHKLRTAGVEIISDISSYPFNARPKIAQIMSFLDIASNMNIISEMNCNILRKEFTELDRSLQEATLGGTKSFNHPVDISLFFDKEDDEVGRQSSFGHRTYIETGEISKGHTRIGVQKGSTLLKALSDRTKHLSDRKSKDINDFIIIKKQRQEEIIKSIKKNSGSATITDIKNNAEGSLMSCGEKTLQRELVNMVKIGVLDRTGEKRWSRYSIHQ